MGQQPLIPQKDSWGRFKQISPPHSYGSSHGGSRIIRQATGEGMEYVPY